MNSVRSLVVVLVLALLAIGANLLAPPDGTVNSIDDVVARP